MSSLAEPLSCGGRFPSGTYSCTTCAQVISSVHMAPSIHAQHHRARCCYSTSLMFAAAVAVYCNIIILEDYALR